MQIRFGLVKEIQFVTEKGEPVDPEQSCNLAQELCNQGAEAVPPYDVFTMSETCGDPEGKSYLVFNGPEDTDGNLFYQQAVAINDKYVAQRPLTDEKRTEMIAEKKAFFQSYFSKLSGLIQVKYKSDQTFEF